MIVKGKSNLSAYLKYIRVLPIAATALTTFAQTEIHQISEITTNDPTEIKGIVKENPTIIKRY